LDNKCTKSDRRQVVNIASLLQRLVITDARPMPEVECQDDFLHWASRQSLPRRAERLQLEPVATPPRHGHLRVRREYTDLEFGDWADSIGYMCMYDGRDRTMCPEGCIQTLSNLRRQGMGGQVRLGWWQPFPCGRTLRQEQLL
jgi:hypothetical protein